ncbi:IMPACT family protein [Phytohalomonas tamaricis]|uniref:IMPACT family protein n=1 Tax=Phytohalomonas tamaricis TaxID=2081032 RepID=UPI000D0BAA65|nr:YigZ family protein [Phytohalomonas tamaricis]
MAYPIPDLPENALHVAEFEVQKSRFITWIAHAPDIDAAHCLVGRARSAYSDARHHCSAFIAGPPGEQNAIGFSDDGEPGGTAGRPMFQVLDGSGLGQIACVVIRYFGGIKLGTGGLARAYSKAVLLGLEQLPTVTFVPRQLIQLKVDFAGERDARSWLEAQVATIENVCYGADGVILSVAWPTDMAHDFSELEIRLKGQLTLVDNGSSQA